VIFGGSGDLYLNNLLRIYEKKTKKNNDDFWAISGLWCSRATIDIDQISKTETWIAHSFMDV